MLATKTFLFSDLRDFTPFVEKHGDAAAAVLIGDYRRIVRAEIAKHEGAEVKTEGDSFYVVFPGARAAVAAAQNILREAERYSQANPDRPLRIGIGINAGEPQPHEGQYVGSAVIVAARLAQAASAGELLVTDLVRALLPRDSAQLNERVGLALKGIDEPPRVFTVGWRGSGSRGAATTEVAIEAAPPMSRQVLCPIVVGRDTELGVLTAALAEAVSGRARTVLVSGEAGLGKTALLRRFREAATAAGARVLVGECSEVEARRPFGPFIDALSGAAIALPADLSQGGPGAEPIGEAERYRVHQGFAERIVQTSRDAPLVLAIEDLHWADEATLELVPYLARKLRDARVLLLATYRSDELYRLHPLNHVLAELARGRLADDVRLHKLGLEETGSVLRAAMGLNRAPTTAFRQAIWERTEGNPFFIEEILRALVEKGEVAYRDGAWRRTKEVADLAIPVSIRDAVQQRLVAMEPTARKVMQVAAVIGPRFEFDLLVEVSGFNEQQVLDGIKSAIDQQLVREDVDAADEAYAFRHALSRESVLAELLQRERRLLHRSVGEALEKRSGGGAGRAEDLAYHFDQARDTARAYRYHQVAAADAERAYAHARAVGHLERAVELASDDDPQLGAIELRLALAAFNAGDVARADRAAAEARALYRGRNDARGSGVAAQQHSTYRWTLGDTDGAMEVAREAVSLLEPLGTSGELAAAYGTVARLAMLRGNEHDALAFGERALALARETGEHEAEVHALITVGTARARHRQADGLATIREGIALADRYGLVSAAQRGYQNLSASYLRYGDRAQRRAVHDEAVAHGRRYGFRPSMQLNRELAFAFADGDWDSALRIAEQESDDTIWSAGRELLAAVIVAAREGPERALPRIEDPMRRLLAARDPQWLVTAVIAAAIPYLAGDYRRALELSEPVAPLVDVPAITFPHFTEPPLVTALLAARQLDEEAVLQRWVTVATGTRADEHMVMAADVADALTLERDGKMVEAAAMMVAAARKFGGDSIDAASVALLREFAAQLFATGGDRERAATAVAPVVNWLRRGDGRWYLRRIEAWAAEYGVALPS